MDLTYEQQKLSNGFKNICGIDEAGRGCLAGPLIAGAVIFDLNKTKNASEEVRINDSKQLTPEKRYLAFNWIINNALSWSVGVAHHFEIDKHGLSFANKIAMKRAWKYLKIKPDFIVSDYLAKLSFETPFELIIKGDSKIFSVAAASIIAKVMRDSMMNALAKKYPDYGFEIHKGYGTSLHYAKINELGPCPIHRLSFEPFKAKLF